MEQDFLSQPKRFVGTLARLFAMDSASLEVAVLAHPETQFAQTGYDNWNGGTYTYGLYVVAGFGAVVLILQGPHVKHFDVHWRITLLRILQ